MFKVLIADDEWMIREGLKQTIDWESLGCELVGEAADGELALQAIRQHEPDILISDIRMPGIDGLGMASAAKALYPELKIIFLTGFDDFAYAQQAIKLNASDFVLKPTDPDALMQAIQKVCKEIASQRQRSIAMEQLLSWKKDGEPLIVQKLLYDHLLGDQEGDSVRKLTGWLFPEGRTMPVRVVVAKVGLSTDAKSVVDGLWLQLRSQMCRYAIGGHMLRMNEGHAAWLLSGTDEAVGLLQAGLPGIRGGDVCFGVSAVHETLEQLGQAYKEALQAIKQIAGHEKQDRPVVSVYGELEHMDHHAIHLAEGFRQVELYIHNHYHEDISLQGLAAMFHMSEAHFSRLFRKRTGVSFVEYVTRLRMEQAKRLLEDEHVRVYEVSQAVGYQDSRYFSQIFRKYTGETPSEYHKKTEK
ncbi:response regulator [Paenibacillus sp. 7541]|uniref:response regulator transcription factor n=1 Tax=Paenibacillus sp. 7541 TaxID=2026236 RepID=UPI000BA5024C|nr:response regulator [Paenibacillus sp. 7541]PAK55994.1 hypothetical protein CHH75_01695 [Paenibacillus sp. 7541]